MDETCFFLYKEKHNFGTLQSEGGFQKAGEAVVELNVQFGAEIQDFEGTDLNIMEQFFEL